MTATITTDVDVSHLRVGVTLDGWSADGDVVVYREHPDGSLHKVRGLDRVSGGQGFAWDYEAPLGTPVGYQALDGATTVISRGPVTRTNRAPNPKAATTGGWQANAGGGTASSSSSALAGVTGVASTGYLTTWSVAATGNVWAGYGSSAAGTHAVVVTPLATETYSLYVKTSRAGQRYRAQVNFYTAAGVFISSLTPADVAVPAGTPTQLTATGTVPATAARALVIAQQVGGTGASLMKVGDTLALTGVLAGPAGTFFDGSSNVEEFVYGWLGATDASQSTERERYATLAVDGSWLKAPGLPSLDVSLTVVEKPTITRRRSQMVLRPIGRVKPVVQPDVRTSQEYNLRVRTKSDDEANTLFACLDQAPTCLLLMPGTRTAWQYVAIGDVTEVPFVDFRSEEDGDVGSWAEWDLTCIEVDSPPGGVFGDPTASYQAVLDTYASYSAVLAAKATYLELLRGV